MQQGSLIGHAWPPAIAPAAVPDVHVRVRVETAAEAVLPAWAALEDTAPCSIYQTRRWLLPCIEAERTRGIRPIFVVGLAPDGRATALLPLGLRRVAGLTIAQFLGGAHANINMGLFAPEGAWTQAALTDLLRAAAAASDPRIDVFLLRSQPLLWEGTVNPLTLLPHGRSPADSAVAPLDGPAAGDVGPSALKRLRKKARRLALRYGPLKTVKAGDAETAFAILAAFRSQKVPRLKAGGIRSDFETAAIRDFFQHAATDGLGTGRPSIELFALKAGDRIVATFAGGGHSGRFSGMFNSFDADDVEVARSSPGDLLLAEVIARTRREGYRSFDLGLGLAHYKQRFCRKIEPMIDVVLATTAAGRPLAQAFRLRLRLLRTIKRTPWLWSLACFVRSIRGLILRR